MQITALILCLHIQHFVAGLEFQYAAYTGWKTQTRLVSLGLIDQLQFDLRANVCKAITDHFAIPEEQYKYYL